MRCLSALALLVVAGGCSGSAAQSDVNDAKDEVDKGKGQIVGPEPWEIIYVRSMTTGTGDCTNPERMDKEVHIAPQGVTVYLTHYADAGLVPMGEPAPTGVDRKLMSTILPDQDPARTIIEVVEENRYYDHVEHSTYALSPQVQDACSMEVEAITITLPDKTGIITFVHGPDHDPPSGVALEIYKLLTDNL